MGQLAEDKIDGLSCEWCGIYFVKPHGHPVVCHSCWKDGSPDERKEAIRAYHKELT